MSTAAQTDRWRAAVIGCGWIGAGVADDPRAVGIQAHAAAYRASPDTLLAGVCDTDPARAAHAAQRFGLPRGHTELAALLAEVRPQIVSVCTPDASHAAVVREVLGCAELRAIVVEKPLAQELAQAREVVELARRRGVTLAVNYTRRFAPSHVQARRRIAAGEIGRVVAVNGLYTKGVLHNGSHWFDLARWLVGDIVRVQAWPAGAAAAADPTCHVRVGFAHGQSGFLTGLDEAHFTAFELDCIGSAGRLRISDSGMRLDWYGVGDSPYYSGYRTLLAQPAVAGGFADAALRVVEDTVMAARSGRAPQCSGTDALAALAVAEAARRSLQSGAELAVEASV
jgi:predicted dehydrogenase